MRSKPLMILTMLSLLGGLCTAARAQQVTTEMIGSFSGNLTANNFPTGPCFGQTDNITFTGSVHVVANVDTTANTVDYHFNLLSVKGAGTVVTKYIGTGATDLLDQGFPGANITIPIQINANLYPNGPCRAGYPSAGTLPIVVTVSFGTDFTLNGVSAAVCHT
jgi:hypothetical protein